MHDADGTGRDGVVAEPGNRDSSGFCRRRTQSACAPECRRRGCGGDRTRELLSTVSALAVVVVWCGGLRAAPSGCGALAAVDVVVLAWTSLAGTSSLVATSVAAASRGSMASRCRRRTSARASMSAAAGLGSRGRFRWPTAVVVPPSALKFMGMRIRWGLRALRRDRRVSWRRSSGGEDWRRQKTRGRAWRRRRLMSS